MRIPIRHEQPAGVVLKVLVGGILKAMFRYLAFSVVFKCLKRRRRLAVRRVIDLRNRIGIVGIVTVISSRIPAFICSVVEVVPVRVISKCLIDVRTVGVRDPINGPISLAWHGFVAAGVGRSVIGVAIIGPPCISHRYDKSAAGIEALAVM